jgi:hypothetical protein
MQEALAVANEFIKISREKGEDVTSILRMVGTWLLRMESH